MDGSFEADEFVVVSGVDRQNLPIFKAVLLITDGDLIFDESSRNTEFSVHKDKILHAAKSSFALLHQPELRLLPAGSLGWLSPHYAVLTRHQTQHLRELDVGESASNRAQFMMYATPISLISQANLDRLCTWPAQASTLQVVFPSSRSATDLPLVPCAVTTDIVGRGRDRLMDVDFMKADQQNTFRGPYLIPTSTLDLHSAVAAVIGYPQPVARKLVEERFSKTYKIKSDHELDKLHAKINYQFNGGKHKTVSPCYVYTHLKDSPAPEIPIVALHTGSTLPGNCGSPVIHCATGDLIGVHLGTSAVENYNLLITVHHPSFVYFYTHVLLPQWIELGIEGDYKARIKNYLKVHFASEHLNNQVLEYFGINIKKRKRKEDKGDRGEKQDNEKPPAKKPRTRVQPPRQKSAKELISSDEEASSPASPKENTTGSSSTNKYDDLLGPPSTPERTADSPLNIDYFMYE